MNIIEELKKKVEKFNNALEGGQLMAEIIADNEAYIADLNEQDQLFEQGINSLGTSIWDYQPYSINTIGYKEAKGQPSDRVTLRDEGDFHESFYVQPSKSQFFIGASDFKTEKLTRKYGDEILGLTDENKQKLAQEVVYPELLEAAKQMIYG